MDDEYNVEHSKYGRILIDIINLLICIHILLYELLKRNPNNNLSSLREYENQSISIIESGLSILSEEERKVLRSSDYVNIIYSKQYKNSSPQKIQLWIKKAFIELEDLKNDVNNILDSSISDFKSLIQQPNKYHSLIHIKPLAKANFDKLNKDVKKVILEVELEDYQGNDLNNNIRILQTKGIFEYADKGILIGGKGERYRDRMVNVAGRLLLDSIEKDLLSSISFFSSWGDGIYAYYNSVSKIKDQLNKEIYSLLPKNNEEECINIYSDDDNNIESYRYSLERSRLDDKLIVEEASVAS